MHPGPVAHPHLARIHRDPSVEVVAQHRADRPDHQQGDGEAEHRLQHREREDVESHIAPELRIRIPEGRAENPHEVGAPFTRQRCAENQTGEQREAQVGGPAVLFCRFPVVGDAGGLDPFIFRAREAEIQPQHEGNQEGADGAQRDGPAPLGPEHAGRADLFVPFNVGVNARSDDERHEENG